MHHDGLEFFWDTIESLLNHMTAKSIHAEGECISPDRVGNGDDLIWCAVFEAALDEEVAETVGHERKSLRNDGLNDVILLILCAKFELLLEKD